MFERSLSEEQAAVSIQSNFRGYKARKDVAETKGYHAQGTSTYDLKTTKLLRKCCRKWRKRSVFHALLLYRRVRSQDLVYFNQQAHCYNQGAMEGLAKTSNENVPSDKIKSAKRGDAIALLGRPPIFIKKVPYQLQTLPFWDTSYFCDPADAGMDVMYSEKNKSSTGGPGDFDTWDAPLRRKKDEKKQEASKEPQVIMRRNKRVRDQGVQTGAAAAANINNQQAPSMQIHAASPHIQMPYRRELLDNQPKMKKTAPRPAAVSASVSSSQVDPMTDVPRRNVSAMRGDFEKNGVGSQRGPPRSPSGHIKELKSLGKDMAGGEEGTFNFQGMLRKTNYSRGSMKRDISNIPGSGQMKISSYSNRMDSSSMWEGNDTQLEQRGPSYSAVVKRQNGTSENSSHNNGNRHELAPGVIVEGEVADL